MIDDPVLFYAVLGTLGGAALATVILTIYTLIKFLALCDHVRTMAKDVRRLKVMEEARARKAASIVTDETPAQPGKR